MDRSKFHTESMFMDSGAFSLFTKHIMRVKGDANRDGVDGYSLYRKRRLGTEQLDPPVIIRGQVDFSFYSLEKGSVFRRYCDRYASWIKTMVAWGLEIGPRGMIVANVDVIMSPEKTWEVQQYFECEHGLRLVPVIHGGTEMKYIDCYLETGKYDLIGLGGLGQHYNLAAYTQWADRVYTHLCPASNDYMPIVKTHGFAMTSWKFICRWPWWSVDSATWTKLAAYGWLYVPRWTEGKGWRFDRPPIQINVSDRSPFLRKRDIHVDRMAKDMHRLVRRWLDRVGLTGEEGEEKVRTIFDVRAFCNIHYMKDLEESRPEWPHPLDPRIVWGSRVRYQRGFGL